MIILMVAIQFLATPIPLGSRLMAPEERQAVLRSLIDGVANPAAKEKAHVVRILVRMSKDEDNDLHTKIYAIRALGTLKSGVPTLLERILGPFVSEEERALGIESARALARFAPPSVMAQWLVHPEPELRSIAARLGGSSETLCKLIQNDPWPMVRRTAVQGLSATSNPQLCLGAALSDPMSSVRLASLETLSDSHGLLSETERQLVIKRLRSLVKDRTQKKRIREQAMLALGKMGDCSAARAALTVYLDSGALKSLLFAAIGSLQRCDELNAYVPKLLASSNDQVVMLGVRAAFEESETKGCETIEALRSNFVARRRSALQDLFNRCTEPTVQDIPSKD